MREVIGTAFPWLNRCPYVTSHRRADIFWNQSEGKTIMSDQVVLEVRSIGMSFGPVEALKDVSLSLRAGRVHTLLGENGAGKSTLMKILAGVYRPTRGKILLAGQEVSFENPAASTASGIAIIFQELSLASNLTVAENVYANHAPHRFGIVNEKQLFAQAEKLLRELHIPIDPSALVASLSMAQRQLIEMAKALSRPSRVVIMDEPTSSLSNQEAEILFGIIEQLKGQGRAVVYISHRMEEIMKVSDDISVLRDGQYICTLEREQTDINALIALMVGREMRDIYPPRLDTPAPGETPVLAVSRLSSPKLFDDVSFHVGRGEVVGFFGLVGAGRSDVMNALFGMVKSDGSIRINGRETRLHSPVDAIANGIAFVTENRKEQGLVLSQSVMQNISMVDVHYRSHDYSLVQDRAEEELTRSSVASLTIKTSNVEQAASELSGGNQQKIVLAKWLAIKPTILILDEPTRGVDVGAKFEIYGLIRKLAAQGTAILLVSSELPEVLAMSDRLVVMRAKKAVKEFECGGLTPEVVMRYATGAISS